jgi:AhpD family alkylhydroperoxidase
VSTRIDYSKVAPGASKGISTINAYVDTSGLETVLLKMVDLRASQINGCAYCLDMHANELRELGEPQQRLDVLGAWRETSLFSERERAALAWTEAVTNISDGHASDEVYAETLKHFTDKELVDLTAEIVAINGWNRFCIAFRSELGS